MSSRLGGVLPPGLPVLGRHVRHHGHHLLQVPQGGQGGGQGGQVGGGQQPGHGGHSLAVFRPLYGCVQATLWLCLGHSLARLRLLMDSTVVMTGTFTEEKDTIWTLK